MANATELTVLKQRKKRSKGASDQEQEKNWVAILALVAMGISALSLLIQVLSYAGINRIATKPNPTLVQTIDGKSITITALQGKERSPEVIRKFTLSTMEKLFNWRVYLLPTNSEEMRTPKIDPGMPIVSKGQSNLKLPTPVWKSSFAISDDFRDAFITEHLAPLIAALKVLQGTSEVAFIPVSAEDPVPVVGSSNEKLWKVKIVANLAIRTSQSVPETLIPFNKTIFIRAVEPPTAQDEKLTTANDMQTAISVARNAGLEIYGLRDYDKEDLTK
jgi:hypothetical protein